MWPAFFQETTIPQRGDVALYAPDMTNPIDQLIIACQIRANYHEPFVHCEVFLDDWFLVGAVGPAVRLGNLGLLTPARIVTPPWPSADGPRLAAEYAAKQVGTLYNVPGVALTGLGLVVPAWKHALLAGADALGRHLAYCSQLVTNALLAGGLTPPDPAAASSPAALAAWLGAS